MSSYPEGREKEKFIKWVQELYRQNPGGVSSIAYHKLEHLLRESRCYQVTHGEQQALYALRQKQLVFYWSNQKERFLLSEEQLAELDFLVLHADYYLLVADALSGLQTEESYPLFYDSTWQQQQLSSSNYEVASFDFANDGDYAAAAAIITSTNAGYKVTPTRVRSWTADSAFDPTLWLLVKERGTGQPVGVGISGYYPPMQEADLDWFFVHPAHQGIGIGRMLVAATVARCQSKARIIRLSGIADGFYTKCGFKPGDKWIIMHR